MTMGRPLKGKETRVSVSIRLEPSIIDKIKKHYPNLSAGVNLILEAWEDKMPGHTKKEKKKKKKKNPKKK